MAVSQGASNISLTAMMTGAILNMILDPIVIYILDLGVQGASIATLISQIVTCAICFGIVFTVIMFVLASPLLSLFSDNAQVLAIAVPALRANTIMFIPVILLLPMVWA